MSNADESASRATANERPEDPGLVCLECGGELAYKGAGRRPRYCSSSCRHRSWERRRAAKDGVVASQVVELPALPIEPSYDRDGVAAWLAEKPGRLADVLDALPEELAPEGALCRALNRLRRPVPAEPSTLTNWEQYQGGKLEHATQGLREDHEHMRSLAAERDAWRARVADNSTVGSQVPAAGTSPHSASEGRPGTQPPPDERAMEMGGKTFHVPAGLSRQQARKWCRDNPNKAVD